MWCPAEERGPAIALLYERARNWAIGSDPGPLRLRMASRTTADHMPDLTPTGEPERLRSAFISDIKHWQVDYGCSAAVSRHADCPQC
jgi:hypothetical protein